MLVYTTATCFDPMQQFYINIKSTVFLNKKSHIRPYFSIMLIIHETQWDVFQQDKNMSLPNLAGHIFKKILHTTWEF